MNNGGFCLRLQEGRIFSNLAAVLLYCFCLARCSGQEATLSVDLVAGTRANISIWAEGSLAAERIMLFRSTSRLETNELDIRAHPITVWEFPGRDSAFSLFDSFLAHNVVYYYRARLVGKDGREIWTNHDSIEVPDVKLGTLVGASILVDKLHYFLEVRDGGRMKKRYPIALGSDPYKRKLHQDNLTTPEGIYRVAAVQSGTTFQQALVLDYPNATDRYRYEYCRMAGRIEKHGRDFPGLGGDIQIQGGGIEQNWTNGSIALRNQDMTELLAHPRIGRNVPVFIVGSELRQEDISSIEDYRTPREIREIQEKLKRLGYYSKRPDGNLGRETCLALARLQEANGLPITCALDRRTVALLAELP